MRQLFFISAILSQFQTHAGGQALERYVKATPENTAIHDGASLRIVNAVPSEPSEITRSDGLLPADSHWHIQMGVGSGTDGDRFLLTTSGAEGNNAPVLKTTVSNLKPKTPYRVFGFFWVDGTADDAKPQGEQCWDIRFGLSLHSMRGYGFADHLGQPDTIGLNHRSGVVARQSTSPMRDTAGQPSPDVIGGRSLFRVSMGISMTDTKGTLVAYTDDHPLDANKGRTCFDGLAVAEAPDEKAEAGSGSSAGLTLAVRAGDWEMMGRELAAGADPNTIDAEGMSPLAYLCVAGETDRAIALLKAGARPDVPGQLMAPIWAAALQGNQDLTKVLVGAGASVAPTKSWTQIAGLQTGAMEPVAAAYRSGSVETLRAILGKHPELNLETAVFGPGYDVKKADPTLVSFAANQSNQDMAVHLINEGYSFATCEGTGNNLPLPSGRFGSQAGNRTAIIKAVMSTPPMLSLIEALEGKGVAPVFEEHLEYDSVVVPWDALSAAVWEGNVGLTATWLPLAAKAPDDYRILLTTLADACGNDQVEKLVNAAFPKVPRAPYPHPYDPVERSRSHAAGGIGEFEPRIVARQRARQPDSPVVLAFIPGPNAATAANILTEKASESPRWKVVERDAVSKLLTERSISADARFCSDELNAIGDGLVADVIIRTSRMNSVGNMVYCLEAFSVKTGLPFDRIFIATPDFKPDPVCADYLSRISAKIADIENTGPLAGISLLKISAADDCPGGNTLANQIQAGLLQSIDGTSGLIALTREQIARIASEKVLKGSDGLWGAAWTLEGGIAPIGNGRIELSLRISSTDTGKATKTVKSEGDPAVPRAIVTEAWKQLVQFMDKKPTSADASDKRATEEAARLLREAEWIANGPRNWEGVTAADAAYFLGADPAKALMVRMRCHWNTRHVWNPREQWGSIYPSYFADGFPLRPEFHDYTRRWIGEYLEILRVISESLDRMLALRAGQNGVLDKNQLTEFWMYAEDMARFRAKLVPKHLDNAQRTATDEYEVELCRFVRKLISCSERFPELIGKEFLAFETITQHFRLLSGLGDCFSETILRHTPDTNRADPGYVFESDMIPGQTNTCEYSRPRPAVVAGLLEKHLPKECPPALLPLRKAEIQFLRGGGAVRSVAGRQVLLERSAIQASSRSTPCRLISDDLLNMVIPIWDYCYIWRLSEISSALSTLVAAPRSAPDLIYFGNDHFRNRMYYIGKTSENRKIWNWFEFTHPSAIDRQFKALCAANAPADRFYQLLEAVLMKDEILGCDYGADLAAKIERERPKPAPPPTFGSKGQFTAVVPDGAVRASLLTDVRTGVDDGAAIITRAMIDPGDRNLLWVVLHSVPGQDLAFPPPPSGPRGAPVVVQKHEIQCKNAWLVGVDCATGKLVNKVDLFESAGIDPATEAPGFPELGLFLGEQVAFNDNQMLLTVRNKNTRKLVVVERKTANVKQVSGVADVLASQLVETDGSDNPAMVGLGDGFYLIENTFKGDFGGAFPYLTVLWQITSDARAIRLSNPGKRPADSPFDDVDRRPCLLRVDKGKLLVASSWEHVSFYDPAANKWEVPPGRTRQEWAAHVRAIDTRDFQATLFPHHILEAEGASYYFGGPDQSSPGFLAFCIGGKAGSETRLPLVLTPPESDHGGFVVGGPVPIRTPDETVAPERVSVSDLARSHMVCPVILNQTESHFVMGLRFNGIASPVLPLKHHAMLPYLWLVDKKTMAAAAKEKSK